LGDAQGRLSPNNQGAIPPNFPLFPSLETSWRSGGALYASQPQTQPTLILVYSEKENSFDSNYYIDFCILKFVKLLITHPQKLLSLAHLSPTVDRDRRPWRRYEPSVTLNCSLRLQAQTYENQPQQPVSPLLVAEADFHFITIDDSAAAAAAAGCEAAATIWTLVFHSVVASKLLHASPAWCGFTTATDRQRVDAFLRRSKRTQLFCPADLPTLEELLEDADQKLFCTILSHPERLLHQLLPAPSSASQHYGLRHLRERPERNVHLTGS